MLNNAAKTGVEVASDVIDGRSFSDSVKDRVPTGINKGVEELRFSLHLQSDEDQRQEDIDAGVTSFRNGICSRTVVQMHKIRVGSVFGAAYPNQHRAR